MTTRGSDSLRWNFRAAQSFFLGAPRISANK
jgi:hypothetical protein